MNSPLNSKINNLFNRLIQGEHAALAKTITLIENELPAAVEINRAIQGKLGHARVVGFTGSPGAGKSTLINAYIRELRKQDLSVAVVAIDPSSPISGGAVLGDRIRMSEHISDPDVFIRSLSSRGKSGGLAEFTVKIIDVMDASRKDVIIVETVGSGQSEVEIAEIADISIVLCPPGLGDGIQAIKAGILEIADILVVNKADLPLAEKTVQELRSALELRKEEKSHIPVLSTVATSGEGIPALANAIASYHHNGSPTRHFNHSKRILKQVADKAARQIKNHILKLDITTITSLCKKIESGEFSIEEVVEQCIEAYIQNSH